MWDKINQVFIYMALIGLYWIGFLGFFSLVRDIWRDGKNGVKWIVGKVRRKDDENESK